MLEGLRMLAVVPARSGSKGIPDKNMSTLGGLSLIARAAVTLGRIPWLDRRVISTDSPRYAEEGMAYGLDAPFLRPAHLSTDAAGALETFVHVLESCEQADGCRYDVLVVAEPTSPLREASDIEQIVRLLLARRADAALTVSRIDAKVHPDKQFTLDAGRVRFVGHNGPRITSRHMLDPHYSRNGLCYCYRRETLLAKRRLITENTVAVVTDRPVANIDEPLDLLWADFLLQRVHGSNGRAWAPASDSITVDW